MPDKDHDDAKGHLKYGKCDHGDAHVKNFVKFTSRAKQVLDARKATLEPTEKLEMLDRLNIKALIQDAMLEYAYIADDVKKSDEVQTLTKPRLETLKKLEAEIGLHYDEKAWKFVSDKPAGTDDKQPEDDDDDSDKNDNVPDDEHEVAVVRNFVTAYRRARHCYFQKVFALQPGDDMNPKDALECVKKFRLCQNLYFKIPKAILEEVRTKFTAGQIYNEIGDFLECLQMFVDEYMSNEM